MRARLVVWFGVVRFGLVRFGEVHLRRVSLALLAGMVGLSGLAAVDVAAAQTCFTLQAELMHLQEQGRGGGGDRARYERAYREQENVLERTEARAHNAGCFGNGFLFFRREPDRICRTLVPKIRDMQGNLDRLDQLRRRSGGGNVRRIRMVQGMLAARGCGLPDAEAWRDPQPEEFGFDDNFSSARGTFRTLCVRTCDGYYFPISFSTTQQQFGDDAQTCSAMCPGAEARLFYHANPGGGPEDMVSVEGQPYSTMPAAFQYRTSLNPSCTCRPAGGISITPADPDGRPALDAPVEERGAVLPRPRPAPGEDPETLSNRAGNFVPGARPANAAVASAATPDGSVRIVGPAFGASPEQEGIVLTPVPN